MKKLFFLILTLILCLSLAAQEYTLPQLIDCAWQNSYPAVQSQVNQKNAESYLRSSWMALVPSAHLYSTKYRNFEAEPSEWNSSINLSLQKSIHLFEPDVFNIAYARLDKINAELSLTQQRKKTAFHVLSLYMDVLIARYEKDIYQQNLQLQEKITAQTKVLYDNGKAALLDLQQSRINVLDYSIALQQAEINLSSARKNLFAYLNMKDENLPLQIYDFDFDCEFSEVKTNTQIDIRQNLIKKTGISLMQLKADFLPSLSISYEVNLFNDKLSTHPNDFQRNCNEIAVNLSYDFGGLLAKREEYSRLKRSNELLEFDLADYTNSWQNKSDILKLELQNMSDLRKMYEEKIVLAEENLTLAQMQYEQGSIGLIDLERNVIALADARLQNQRSIYNFILKREELNVLLSQPVLGKW